MLINESPERARNRERENIVPTAMNWGGLEGGDRYDGVWGCHWKEKSSRPCVCCVCECPQHTQQAVEPSLEILPIRQTSMAFVVICGQLR